MQYIPIGSVVNFEITQFCYASMKLGCFLDFDPNLLGCNFLSFNNYGQKIALSLLNLLCMGIA